MVAPNTAIDTLVSLVYVSSARRQLSALELKKLLAEARIRNQRRSITGMLLYRGGNFIQVIEGPASSVDQLVESLRRDPRHCGMLVMKRSEIEERQFGEWQMAFQDITNADLTTLKGYSPFMEHSFTETANPSKSDISYKLLIMFKDKVR